MSQDDTTSRMNILNYYERVAAVDASSPPPFYNSDDVAHEGISCDGPHCEKLLGSIRGVRYACAVCEATNFCSKCEPHHKHSHPRTAFRQPENSHVRESSGHIGDKDSKPDNSPPPRELLAGPATAIEDRLVADAGLRRGSVMRENEGSSSSSSHRIWNRSRSEDNQSSQSSLCRPVKSLRLERAIGNSRPGYYSNLASEDGIIASGERVADAASHDSRLARIRQRCSEDESKLIGNIVDLSECLRFPSFKSKVVNRRLNCTR